MNAQSFFTRSPRFFSLGFWCCGLLLATTALADSPRVKLVRTPDGGIQPQAAIDSKGVIHLIYYKGSASAGEIFYVRQAPGQEVFSEPMRVNSPKGSAMAAGTIRGAQMALGRNGRVHVAWNGPAPGEGEYMKAPMLYTRLNDAGTAFEPERDVITEARGLDGGGSVAADGAGHVYVMWHAPKPGNTEGEAGRTVFVVRSSDDGKTFSREQDASPKPTGACGCCGMRAFADSQGNVFALYRAASEKVNRDETLLISRNHGESFEIATAHPWHIASCPMSSASLTEQKGSALAAWETDGQVYFASVNPKTMQVTKPAAPPGPTKGKHPVAVANGSGEMLLVWTEGTGWQRGGSLAWQLYDPGGKPGETGRADGVPIWGLASAVAKADGSFVIFY